MELDRARIIELVKILKSSSAAELAVEEGGVRVRISRAITVAPPAIPQAAGEAALQPTAVVPQVVGESIMAAAEVVTVTSRFVGLFYPGKESGGKPLVEVGEEVMEGQPLGIIEVLRKPMEVISPATGKLEQVLVDEGTPVQYGDPLFVIRL